MDEFEGVLELRRNFADMVGTQIGDGPIDMQSSLRSAYPSGDASPSGLADGWAETCPERLALSDQWGRASWSGRPAARLTWQELRERSIGVAARLSRLTLGPGTLVGLCLPNGSDWMIAFLAVERAGLTPCCLPVAASASELSAAIEAAQVEAVITQAAIGPLRPAETVCAVAGGYYRLRYVLGFGPGLPDGVTDLDPARGPSGFPTGAVTHAGQSRGVVTFERHGERWRPVLRSYPSLFAAAGTFLAALTGNSPETLLTLLAPDDLKAIVAGPVLSLVTGCAIEAHGLFSRADLDRALLSNRTAHLVAPGWMEGALRRHGSTGRLILAHDAPARLPEADPGLDVVDLLALGERAVLAAPRREGLEAAVARASAGPIASRDWLRLRIDPHDGRIHAGGLAAEVSPPHSRTERGRAAPSGDRAEPDAPTPYGVERFENHVVGILSLA